jgi:hypothetical protein
MQCDTTPYTSCCHNADFCTAFLRQSANNYRHCSFCVNCASCVEKPKKMSDSSDSGKEIDIEEAWNVGRSTLIPEKSRERYENTYKIFQNWCTRKCVNITEKSLLAYFVTRNNKLKAPGSLWAEYSMLKSTIFLHDSVDISKFSTLIAFLKKKNVGYRPKKASVFTKDEFIKFLREAPDEKFLPHKVNSLSYIKCYTLDKDCCIF